jgi:hypothetical protein
MIEKCSKKGADLQIGRYEYFFRWEAFKKIIEKIPAQNKMLCHLKNSAGDGVKSMLDVIADVARICISNSAFRGHVSTAINKQSLQHSIYETEKSCFCLCPWSRRLQQE